MQYSQDREAGGSGSANADNYFGSSQFGSWQEWGSHTGSMITGTVYDRPKSIACE